MIQELLYTSAPRGLKPGSRGFCTVLSTQGMSAPLATTLESLSAYRPIYASNSPDATRNPIVYSHVLALVGGRRVSVLSRIADYGLDYSQRTNKLAHHLVLEPSDRPAGGPAWLLRQAGLMRTTWEGDPRIVPVRSVVPQGNQAPEICTHWQQLTGDAGWAGVMAEAFLEDPQRLVYLIFVPGMEVLPLLAETISLLPPERRWEATFSTYSTNLPQGIACNWRCVVADSQEANQSRRHVHALRLNLCERMGEARGGALVELARTGRAPSLPEPIVDLPPTSIPVAPPVSATTGRGYRLRPKAPSAELPPSLQYNMRAGRRYRSPKLTGFAGMVLVVLLVTGIAVGVKFARKDDSTTDGALARAEERTGNSLSTPPRSDPPSGDATLPNSGLNEPPEIKPPMPAPPSSEVGEPGEGETLIAAEGNVARPDTPPVGTSEPAESPEEGGSLEPETKDLQRGQSNEKQDVSAGTSPVMSSIQHLQLPRPAGPTSAIDDNEFQPLAEVSIPKGAHRTLSLLVPESYLDASKESDVEATFVGDNDDQQLYIGYFVRVASRERHPLADFQLIDDSNSPAHTSLHFRWNAYENQWDLLRWCVLRVHDADSKVEQLIVLHAQAERRIIGNGGLLTVELPAVKLNPASSKGPELLISDIVLDLGDCQLTIPGGTFTGASGSNERSGQFQVQDLSPLDSGFQGFKPSEWQDKPSFPRLLIQLSPSASSASSPTLKFNHVNLDALKSHFSEILHAEFEALDGRILGGGNTAAQITATYFATRMGLMTASTRWELLARKERDRIAKLPDKERERPQDILNDHASRIENLLCNATRMLDLEAAAKTAKIVQARVYYIVVGDGQEREVDVINIDDSKRGSPEPE